MLDLSGVHDLKVRDLSSRLERYTAGNWIHIVRQTNTQSQFLSRRDTALEPLKDLREIPA